MKEPMFHKRTPDEGTGYRVANAKGAAVTFAFVVAVMALPLGLVIWFEGREWSAYAGGALVFALLIGFIGFVMRNSDDSKYQG